MTHECEIDFESRSDVNLKTRGSYVYFASPHTRVLIGSYRLDDGPVRRWRWPDPCPADLRAAIEAGALVKAHGSQFEYQCFEWLAEHCGWPMPDDTAFRCTMAIAASMGLPRDLDSLGTALNLSTQKDKEGRRLIQLFSVPRKPKKDEPEGIYFNDETTHPIDWAKFHDYCDRDVETESAAAKRMVDLSEAEWAVYHLSERINRRGIRVDRTSAIAALKMAEKAKAGFDARMAELTGGAARKCSEIAKIQAWANDQGVPLASMAEADISDALADLDDMPKRVRAALDLRQEAAKTSVSKLAAMVNRASGDGRVRGTFQYHGAGPGRWTNSGVNFSNMPRPRHIFEEAHLRHGTLFDAIRTEDPETLRWLYPGPLGRPLDLISDAIRCFLWAAPGHEFVQADYNGIQGANAAWLAGEEWKLKALFEIKADPSLPDLYRRTAAAIMNLPVETVTKKHPLRQSVGKVSELACFAAETKILTNNGIKRIVEVLPSDKLWDGVEWVSHQGVISRGARRTVDVDGIAVTPDHLLLAGRTWKPAGLIASRRDMIDLVLATGSATLPFSVLSSAPPAAGAAFACSAHAAAPLMSSRAQTFAAAPAVDAVRADISRLVNRAKRIWAMTMSCLTRRIDTGFLVVLRRACSDARIPVTPVTPIMAGAAFAFSGVKIAGPSWSISSRLMGGTTQNLNSTEKMLTATTLRGIFASLRALLTPATEGKRESCKARSTGLKKKSARFAPVYDIVNAGPRRRFTIFSDNGALIAHNCSFGGGVSSFYSMARNYNMRLAELHALYGPVWTSADEERREKAVKRYERCLRRQESHAHVLSREGWIACEIIKTGWREANSRIRDAWYAYEKAARDAIRSPGTVTSACRMSFIVKMGFLWAQAPSGECIAYAAPKLRDQVWAKRLEESGLWGDAEVMDRQVAEIQERQGLAKIEGATTPRITARGVDSTTRQWSRYPLYGGLFMENFCMRVERDILVHGLFKAEAAGYPIVAHNYDEAIAEVPRGFGSVKAFEELICELPPWAAGLPLTAGGWRGKRYRKE